MPKLFAIRPVGDDQFSRFQRRILLLTLTMSSSLGMVASTIYVPSIPAIAAAFETPISRVQLTFVAYLLAFAASMLDHLRPILECAQQHCLCGKPDH